MYGFFLKSSGASEGLVNSQSFVYGMVPPVGYDLGCVSGGVVTITYSSFISHFPD